jgi:hypothetical protein
MKATDQWYPERQVAQVGGDHYASGYQHWDWVAETGLGYFEGNATKYLTRWRAKNGLEDLKKARSYVDKLIHWANAGVVKNDGSQRMELFNLFCFHNKVEGQERDACLLISLWRKPEDLARARSVIQALIWSNFPEENQAKISTENPFEFSDDPNEGEEDS